MSGGNKESCNERSLRELFCHAAAGASAGAIAATFVCPLDVIKTRLQVHGLPQASQPGHRGSIIVTSLQNIIGNEGLKGMYRGLSPTIVALLPNWAVYFTVYEQLKGLLQSNDDGKVNISIGANMVAAAGAGAATAITTNPLWVVKTRLQGMRPDVVPYRSMFSALTRITREEGIRGLYSGVLPSLAGVSHVAIQFPAYERIKRFLAKKDNTTVDKLSPGNVAIASSISKVIASVMTYPHEVVRSRLQEQGQLKNTEVRYSGVVDCVRKVFRKEGIPGFYRGCATNLLRTTPSAVITFTSFEMIHRFLLGLIPPDEKHAKAVHEPYGRPKSPLESAEKKRQNDTSSLQSETELNKRAPPMPLGNEEQVGAGH